MTSDQGYAYLDKINTVTPGLKRKVIEFIAHLEVAEEKPILITGPTGVGKSLFLNILHQKTNNILIENCANFDPNLAESELFGHVRGSFTGAISDKEGLLEYAGKEKRILVLDEVGELPDNVQAKLLTFIENGRSRRIGSLETKTLNVRIIGVTSRKSQLRPDLCNRFFEFTIPPLYERRGDVLYYIAKFEPDVINTLIASDVLMLLANNWEGNIREINNILLSIKKNRKIVESLIMNDLSIGIASKDLYQKINEVDQDAEKYREWLTSEGSDKTSTPSVFFYKKLSEYCDVKKFPEDLDKEKFLEHFDMQNFLKDPDLEKLLGLSDMKKFLEYFEVGTFSEDSNNEKFLGDSSLWRFTYDTGVFSNEQDLFFRKLQSNNVNYHTIDLLLNRFNIGVNPANRKKVFKEYQKEDTSKNPMVKKIEQDYNLEFIHEYAPFEDAIKGFKWFCTMFFQSPYKNKNALNIREGVSVRDHYSDKTSELPSFLLGIGLSEFLNKNEIKEYIWEDKSFPFKNPRIRKMYRPLLNNIFKFLSGITIPGHLDLRVSNYQKRVKIIATLLARYPDNVFLKSIAQKVSLPEIPSEKESNIWSMKLRELETYYFTGLINLCDGNLTQAAKMAGMPYTTFYYRVKKSEKRNDKSK